VNGLAAATILHGGFVHTMDDAGSVVPAIGFRGGRVAATGALADVRAVLPGAAERDLGGATVYPGFIDAHHHFCFAATYHGFPEARCPPLRCLDDLVALVRRAAAATPVGEWVVLVGYDESRLAERRKPTRDELDQASRDHPVLLVHFTYHEGVLNTLGLRHAGLDDASVAPSGGALGRTARGRLDGRVYERSFGAVDALARAAVVARDRESWFAHANQYQKRVLARGITHVCDAAVGPAMEELYGEWQGRGELRLGVTMMPLADNMFADPSDRLAGAPSGWSEGRLRRGPLKLFLDGGTTCAMCIPLRAAIAQFGRMIGRSLRQRSLLPWHLAQQQPARFGPGAVLHTGMLYYDDEALTAVISRARQRDFSVGLHAAGNEAIRQAVRVLGAARHQASPLRVEHFFFVEDEWLRRAVDVGIHAVVQPEQLRETGDLLRETGLPRGLRYQAFRSMLDAGAILCGSSDAPVVSFDVLAAVQTAVTRRVASGARFDAHQSIGVEDAVAMYTRNAAAVLGMEGEIGALVPGARADAVVLAADPGAVAAERIAEIEVLATWVGGVFTA
jgi:predicted amidohydrolase YtcJ